MHTSSQPAGQGLAGSAFHPAAEHSSTSRGQEVSTAEAVHEQVLADVPIARQHPAVTGAKARELPTSSREVALEAVDQGHVLQPDQLAAVQVGQIGQTRDSTGAGVTAGLDVHVQYVFQAAKQLGIQPQVLDTAMQHLQQTLAGETSG